MNKKIIIKKITITIGIPAYNEEENISILLDKILAQKGNNFLIEKIIIVSDSSRDNTNKIVSAYKNKMINLIINPKRKGQVYAQNLIFKLAKSDLVVLFEADTYPENKYYLSKLIKPLFKNKEVGLVQGYMKPLKTETIVGKALAVQFKIFSKNSLVNSDNINPIPSGRSGRAFTKKVYENLKWPVSVPEDEYAFLWCVSKGINAVISKSAICYFRLPETFSEYIKTMQKNKSASITINKYFSSKIIRANMSTSYKEKMIVLFYFLYENPLLCFVYLVLRGAIRLKTKNTEFIDLYQERQ